MRVWGLLVFLIGVAPVAAREPVLDVHLHVSPADDQGPPPLAMCTPMDPMPRWDDARTSWVERFIAYQKHPTCKDPVWSPLTDAEQQRRTLAEMQRHNVIGVVSGGTVAQLRAWRTAAPGRILFGIAPNPDELFDAAKLKRALDPLPAGDLAVLGEFGLQYGGIAPDDRRLEPLWELAEQRDIPVAIHVGPGPPGAAYFPGMGYRARLSNPLALEDVLVRHPKLRVQVMHAGYPMLDATLALLYAHPQVYLDTGVIVYTQPRAAFHRYLKALVEAGFGDRIMFGSDQMIWPETIGRSIAVIAQAPFLSRQQKRDILYNNAARFLRLDEATIRRHHAM